MGRHTPPGPRFILAELTWPTDDRMTNRFTTTRRIRFRRARQRILTSARLSRSGTDLVGWHGTSVGCSFIGHRRGRSMAGVLCCSRRSERSWARTVTSILVRRFGPHGIWCATTRSRQAMALKSITRRRCTSTRTRLCRRVPMSAAQPTISITRHFPCSLFLWSSEPTPGYARGLRWVRELMWATALCWDWVQLQRATSSRGECTQECRP